MFTFFKAQAASFAASLMDFITTVVAVELLGFLVVPGAALGNIVGGITNFVLGRGWVFSAADGKVNYQALRYFVVWTGNICLNVGGVYIFTHLLGITYVISKVVVSLIVGFSYNYLLQKKYVFR
ncbi:MAG: GtrA family protein [Sphingobacteriales bacterium]|nr:MAG: GtrA family protein [Sphingobacteriales bacterium]